MIRYLHDSHEESLLQQDKDNDNLQQSQHGQQAVIVIVIVFMLIKVGKIRNRNSKGMK